MDSVVKVRRSFLNNIRAFLNIYAEKCHGCLRSSQYGCIDCDSLRAKTLISELDNIRDAEEERFFIENPNEEIQARLLAAVSQGNGKPVSSRDIHIKDVSRLKKFQMLKLLIRKRKLIRVFKNGEPLYLIAQKERLETTTKTRKGKRNGV